VTIKHANPSPIKKMTSSLIIIGATLLFGMVAIFDLPNGSLYAMAILLMAIGMWTLFVIGGAL